MATRRPSGGRSRGRTAAVQGTAGGGGGGTTPNVTVNSGVDQVTVNSGVDNVTASS